MPTVYPVDSKRELIQVGIVGMGGAILIYARTHAARGTRVACTLYIPILISCISLREDVHYAHYAHLTIVESTT